jgi:hypothetical protein
MRNVDHCEHLGNKVGFVDHGLQLLLGMEQCGPCTLLRPQLGVGLLHADACRQYAFIVLVPVPVELNPSLEEMVLELAL